MVYSIQQSARQRRSAICVLLVLLGIGSVSHSKVCIASVAPDTRVGVAIPQLLVVEVNGKRFDQAAQLLDSSNLGLLVPSTELGRWGFMLPPAIEAVPYNSKVYYPLRKLDDLDYSIDSASQVLLVKIHPRQLVGSQIDLNKTELSFPQTGSRGAFINYDLLHEVRSGSYSSSSGTFELAGFNRWGLLTTTLLARDKNQNQNQSGVVRLNTTLRHDDPSTLRTLTLGDTYSRSDSWGRGVLYGGIQWGTNFGTQPDITTFPMPNMRGEAIMPSSVEIYANDQRQSESQLNAGPFSVNNIPVMTGANDLRIVVRDVLGREQVIEQSFYASQQLLRSGLHDYTYEAGSIREDYSLQSNQYGRSFAVASHRLGINDKLTGGGRLEALKDQQTLGLSGAWLASPRIGVVTASVAGSTAKSDDGGLASLGIEHHGRRFSFGANTTATTASFRQLGLREGELPARRTSRANIGVGLSGGSSIGLNYIEIDRREEADSRVVSAHYSKGISRGVALSLYATQELESHDTFVGLSLSASLGERTSGSLSHSRDNNSYSSRVQIQRNLPRGNGFGYNLSTEDGRGQGEQNRSHAQVMAQTDYGTYRAEAAKFSGDTAYRLNAAGGVVLLGGNTFATRRIDDSFGVVKVGSYPKVTVYNENQRVATTNANGAALIPDLRSFEKNRISFEQADLPLSARLDSRDATIIPGFRRGVLVSFDVGSANGALLTVLQTNGEPLPAGATIRYLGSSELFPVARRGEAWVTDLKDRNQFVAKWADNSCYFNVSMPVDPGPMPRIGPLLCQETP